MNRKTTNRAKKGFISRAGWFSLNLSAEWNVDEDEYAAVYNPTEGVGALHISAYRAPGSVDPKSELLQHLSKDNSEVKQEDIKTTIQGTKTVASFERTSGESFEKVWFVGDGPYLLIATYICDFEDKQKETSEIEDIIRSITITPTVSRN
jgi:Domain of unknown function (DUF3805)